MVPSLTSTSAATTGCTSGKSKHPHSSSIRHRLTRRCQFADQQHSLQLNIGIIAACAQFLRPLLGRVLKLNSTSAKSYPQYNQENRGKYGLQTIGSSATKRRTRLGSLNVDEFELQTKNLDDRDSGVGVGEGHDSSETSSPAPTVPRRASQVRAPQRHREHPGGGNTHTVAAFYSESTTTSRPDSNSEEFILHRSDKVMEGIVCRKDYTVQYSER